MKNIRFFLSEICHFLVVKFSVYLNRRVFVMLIMNHLVKRFQCIVIFSEKIRFDISCESSVRQFT